MSPFRSLGVLCLVGLLMAFTPGASAALDSGSLTFVSLPTLEGTVAGSGGGEIRFFEGDGLDLTAVASTVELTRKWTEQQVVLNPLGEPVRSGFGEVKTATASYNGSALSLDGWMPGFSGLAFFADAADGTVTVPATNHDALSLAAFHEPALVVREGAIADQTYEGDDRYFTYRADGPRWPVPGASFGATGTTTLYLWNASVTVAPTDADSATWTSGVRRIDETPTSYTEVHEYHLFTLTMAEVSVVGPATAWISDPVFDFTGTLRADTVRGEIVIEDETHHLDDVPVQLVGTLALAPQPTGDPVEPDADGNHVGTTTPSGGMYSTSSSTVSGDVRALAVGNELPYAAQQDLAVVASVGVLTLVGAVLLLTPKGKWAAMTVIAPLYAKTQKDRLLDNESRDRIFQAIRKNPGINLSQIHRVAELGWGVTVYHLKMMEKNGLIFAESSARDKCFFENDPRYLGLRTAIAALANKEPVQRIAGAVAESPGRSQREVIEATGLSQRAVSYYLSRLSRIGLIDAERDGNFMRYQPTADLDAALSLVQGPNVAVAPARALDEAAVSA